MMHRDAVAQSAAVRCSAALQECRLEATLARSGPVAAHLHSILEDVMPQLEAVACPSTW